MRLLYLSLGWLFFGIGAVGVVVPVLPTTPFMLLALWGFAKGSKRFHDWLYHHQFFGPPLQQWHQYRVIPKPAKIMSISMMSASLIYITFFTQPPMYITLLIALVMLYAAWFILTKPSVIPATVDTNQTQQDK